MSRFVHEIIDNPGVPWRVICLCDRRGSGSNVAYTVGLAPLGMPELLTWARPTDGEDPGTDWRFSHRDLADVLGTVARLLLAGDLLPGAELALDVDGGLGTVLLQIGPETVAGTLGPLELASFGEVGLADDSYLLPIGWELVRPPSLRSAGSKRPAGTVGSIAGPTGGPPPSGVFDADLAMAAMHAQTARLRVAIIAAGSRPGDVPTRWRPTTAPRPGRAGAPTAPAQDDLGPLDALVRARIQQLLISDGALLTRFVDATFDVGDDAPGEVLGPLTSFARITRREQVPPVLSAPAADVVRLLAGTARSPTGRTPAGAPRSSRLQRRLPNYPGVPEDLMRQRLTLHVEGLLAAEAFADVLPPGIGRQGRMSWLTAVQEGKA